MRSSLRDGGAARVFLGIGLLAVTAFAFMPGCSSNDNNGGGGTPSGPQSYQGAIAGGSGESGVLDVTIAGTSPAVSLGVFQPATAEATGTLTLVGGAQIALTGTYDTVTRMLHLEGGGYTFDGQASSNGSELTGTYTGPSTTGTFVAAVAGSGSSVTVYCGGYDSYDASTYGVWNLIRSGNTLLGSFADQSTGDTGVLNGSVSGTTVTITYESGSATGTIDGTSIGGTWSTGGVERGLWGGSVEACSGP